MATDLIRCEICEEFLASDLESEEFERLCETGKVAEMYISPTEEGIVHTECGLAAGWELS